MQNILKGHNKIKQLDYYEVHVIICKRAGSVQMGPGNINGYFDPYSDLTIPSLIQIQACTSPKPDIARIYA